MGDVLLSIGLPLLVLALATVAWVLSIFSLPGNWIMVLIALLYGWSEGFSIMAWWVLAAGVVLAGLGELVELAGTYLGGGTRGGHWTTGLAAIAGSIVGALVGAAFFWGLGALPGTVVGAFAGAVAAEGLRHGEGERALKVGLGAAVGRALGLAAKLGLGGAFLALLYVRVIWMILVERLPP